MRLSRKFGSWLGSEAAAEGASRAAGKDRLVEGSVLEKRCWRAKMSAGIWVFITWNVVDGLLESQVSG